VTDRARLEGKETRGRRRRSRKNRPLRRAEAVGGGNGFEGFGVLRDSTWQFSPMELSVEPNPHEINTVRKVDECGISVEGNVCD